MKKIFAFSMMLVMLSATAMACLESGETNRNAQYIPLQRGDLDMNGIVNDKDIKIFIDWLFHGGTLDCPMEVLDVDGNEQVDIQDVAYLVDYLYRDGAEPVAL